MTNATVVGAGFWFVFIQSLEVTRASSLRSQVFVMFRFLDTNPKTDGMLRCAKNIAQRVFVCEEDQAYGGVKYIRYPLFHWCL